MNLAMEHLINAFPKFKLRAIQIHSYPPFDALIDVKTYDLVWLGSLNVSNDSTSLG